MRSGESDLGKIAAALREVARSDLPELDLGKSQRRRRKRRTILHGAAALLERMEDEGDRWRLGRPVVPKTS